MRQSLSVDVQSVPRFTYLDRHGRPVYQHNPHQRLHFWEVSVMQQRRIRAKFALSAATLAKAQLRTRNYG